MLKFDDLPDNSVKTISNLLNKSLITLPFNDALPQNAISLCESLKIIELPYNIQSRKIENPIFNGFWIHLLKDSEGYIGHAISTPTGGDETSWKLQGIFKGKTATSISKSLNCQETNVDGVVRFLLLPEHHGYALVIYYDESKYVTGLTLPHCNNIDQKTIYQWDDFIDIITDHPVICDIGSIEIPVAALNTYNEDYKIYLYFVAFIVLAFFILFH